MKASIFVIPLIFMGCTSHPGKNSSQKTDTTFVKKQQRTEKDLFYANSDSVIIASPHYDTIVYSKAEFNAIIDSFPALYNTIPLHPDISYAESGYFKEFYEAVQNKKYITFGSEAGQDRYYILYSYFLKKRNHEEKLKIRRETIISIYQDINDIFGLLRHGGTFFGHQFNRLNAYAEYSIYQYKMYKDIYNELPNITEQKKLYITSLRQIILDEIKVDNEILGIKSKEEAKAGLFKYVNHIDSLISDNFYLKKAQEFQYSNY